MTSIRHFRIFAIALLTLAAVYSAKPAHAQYAVLHNFGKTGDGANPQGAIAQGLDGALYTTSNEGGANGDGTIFKVTPAGSERVLYSFCSLTNCADGGLPAGGLTLRLDGHFLGTTQGFGSANEGNIFDVSQTGSLTTLYNFTGGLDGAQPQAAPIQGPDGSFYGVASFGGGPSGCGSIYRINGNGAFTRLYDFNTPNGCNPEAPLVLGTDGNLYGTARMGGTAGWGVVFKVTLRPGMATLVTVLANFDFTNGEPQGALVEGPDGNFYGTTCGCLGDGAFGSVFKITPSGTLTILHSFNGTTDGLYPLSGLALATDGNFYGTASSSDGGSGGGTLFQITPAGGFSVLHTFDGNDGAEPETTPVQHTNGLLYGDTVLGGTTNVCSGCGAFYSWNGNLPPFVSTIPFMGAAGSSVEILGQGFTSTSTVSFNGVAASATVQSGTSLFATVPAGATTGPVTVTTSTGTLTSNRPFVVTP